MYNQHEYDLVQLRTAELRREHEHALLCKSLRHARRTMIGRSVERLGHLLVLFGQQLERSGQVAIVVEQ